MMFLGAGGVYGAPGLTPKLCLRIHHHPITPYLRSRCTPSETPKLRSSERKKRKKLSNSRKSETRGERWHATNSGSFNTVQYVALYLKPAHMPELLQAISVPQSINKQCSHLTIRKPGAEEGLAERTFSKNSIHAVPLHDFNHRTLSTDWEQPHLSLYQARRQQLELQSSGVCFVLR